MDGKPLHRFYPHHDHHRHHPSTKYSQLPVYSIMVYKPLPQWVWLFVIVGGVRAGERCIDVTGCRRSERDPFIHQDCLSPPVCSHLFTRVSESVGVSIQYPALPRVCSAPYDCKLRVNFHCWLRLGLQTSTVSPPILALRLSRQRLLPT